MSIFELSDDNAVVTSAYVTEQQMPVLEVFHEEDDDGPLWQFHCGNGDFSPLLLRLVRLDTIMRLDPTLLTISGLPAGMRAVRKDIESEWIIEPLPPEED